MAIDPSIALQVKPLQIDSPVNAFGQIAQLQNAQTQNALGRIQMQTAQQGLADQAALREAAKGFGDDPMANYQAILKTGNVKGAGDYLKNALDQQEAKSKINLQTAQAGKANQETQQSQIKFALQSLSGARTPQDALNVGIKAGLVKPEDSASYLQSIPQDPAGFAQWKQEQMAMGVDVGKQMEMKEANRHNTTTEQNTLTTNTATNKAHLQAAGIAAATSRANNAATIAKDYKVSGIDPQTGNFIGLGGSGGGAMDGIIDAVGKNQLPLSTALARVPPAMKAGVMQQLLQKYPDFDETAIATRQAANKAFTTGKEGAAMRSIGTAVKHLDMVDGMVDALANGNLQLLNKIGNAYQTQTGNPAPTNFDAAKEIVGQEVVKAIVAGGGGVGERQEAAAALSNAKSPAQLRGVVKTYKTIMSAQHESLLQQRDAAGLPRSTLPDYTEGAGAPSHPPDIDSLLKKYGK